MTSIGVIANPAAGKDLRRLVAHATVTSDATKLSIVRRAIAGAVDAGVDRVWLMPDRQNLCRRAVQGMGLDADLVDLDLDIHDHRSDSTAAAAMMRDVGVDVVLVLGGDGTNRDVVRGWQEATLVPLSTGTNNVFPIWAEATVAGTAAGLVATGTVERSAAGHRVKVVHIVLPDGRPNLALIDAVLVEGAFVASRAVWEANRLISAVYARAEPASVGMSAVGGLVAPCSSTDEGAVAAWFDPNSKCTVRAPLAPGMFTDVGIDEVRRISLAERVEWNRPGILALDGERDVVVREADLALGPIQLTVLRDGPWVIDPTASVTAAARQNVFLTQNQDPLNGDPSTSEKAT